MLIALIVAGAASCVFLLTIYACCVAAGEADKQFEDFENEKQKNI